MIFLLRLFAHRLWNTTALSIGALTLLFAFGNGALLGRPAKELTEQELAKAERKKRVVVVREALGISDTLSKAKDPTGLGRMQVRLLSYHSGERELVADAIRQGKVDRSMVDRYFRLTLDDFKRQSPDAPAGLWRWMAAHQAESLDFMLDIAPLNSGPFIEELLFLAKESPKHFKKYPRVTFAHASMQALSGRTYGGKMVINELWPKYGDYVSNFRWYVDNADRLLGDIRHYPHSFLVKLMHNNLDLNMRSFMLDALISKEAQSHPEGCEAYQRLVFARAQKENLKTKRFPVNAPFIYKGGACGPAAERNVMRGAAYGYSRFYCAGTGHAWHLRIQTVKESSHPSGSKLEVTTNNDLKRRYRGGGYRVVTLLPWVTFSECDLFMCVEMAAHAYNHGYDAYNQGRLAALLINKHYHNEKTPAAAESLLLSATKGAPQAWQLWDAASYAAKQGKISSQTALKLRRAFAGEVSGTSTQGHQKGKKGGKQESSDSAKPVYRCNDVLHQYFPHRIICNTFEHEFKVALQAGDKQAAKAVATRFQKLYKDSYQWQGEVGVPAGLYALTYLDMLQELGDLQGAATVMRQWAAHDYEGRGRYAQFHQWTISGATTKTVRGEYKPAFVKYFDAFGSKGVVTSARLARELKLPMHSSLTLRAMDAETLRETVLAMVAGDNPQDLDLREAKALLFHKDRPYGYPAREFRDNEKLFRQMIAYQDRFDAAEIAAGKSRGWEKSARVMSRYKLHELVHGRDAAAAYGKNLLENLPYSEVPAYYTLAYTSWNVIRGSAKYSFQEKLDYLHHLQKLFTGIEEGWEYTQSLIDVGAKFAGEEAEMYLRAEEPDKAIAAMKAYLRNYAKTSKSAQTLFTNIMTHKSRQHRQPWASHKPLIAQTMRWYQENLDDCALIKANTNGQPPIDRPTQVSQAFVFILGKPMTALITPAIRYADGRIEIHVASGNSNADPQPLPQNVAAYYTTDGSAPTQASQKYSGPFLFGAKGVVRAILVDEDGIESLPTTLALPLKAAKPGNSKNAFPEETKAFAIWFNKRVAKYPGAKLVEVHAERSGNRGRRVDMVVYASRELNDVPEKEFVRIVKESQNYWWTTLGASSRGRDGTAISALHTTFADIHGNRTAVVVDRGTVRRAYGVQH